MALLSPTKPAAHRRAVGALIALVGLAACDFADPGRTGELDRGRFYYSCENTHDDGFCDRGDLSREFPTAVAVGSSFRLDYEPNDGTVHFDIISGCLDCLQRTDGRWTMTTEGRAPLLVENSSGEIYDLLHIEAKPATDLVVRVDDETWPGDTLVLIAGTLHDFGATPEAADGTELGGSLEYEWTIADTSIIEAWSSENRNDIELQALAAGETTVTVRSGDLSFEIPVEVREAG
ncbi:MAG: Ig-like domain-containing protein [Myxococcota bacterium]